MELELITDMSFDKIAFQFEFNYKTAIKIKN